MTFLPSLYPLSFDVIAVKKLKKTVKNQQKITKKNCLSKICVCALEETKASKIIATPVLLKIII